MRTNISQLCSHSPPQRRQHLRQSIDLTFLHFLGGRSIISTDIGIVGEFSCDSTRIRRFIGVATGDPIEVRRGRGSILALMNDDARGVRFMNRNTRSQAWARGSFANRVELGRVFRFASACLALRRLSKVVAHRVPREPIEFPWYAGHELDILGDSFDPTFDPSPILFRTAPIGRPPAPV